MFQVLIESDWNLKMITINQKKHSGNTVLIESDWNLKYVARIKSVASAKRINRIRLEFKDTNISFTCFCKTCINRIRLEFKA